jgi:hypothetical protein
MPESNVRALGIAVTVIRTERRDPILPHHDPRSVAHFELSAAPDPNGSAGYGGHAQDDARDDDRPDDTFEVRAMELAKSDAR